MSISEPAGFVEFRNQFLSDLVEDKDISVVVSDCDGGIVWVVVKAEELWSGVVCSEFEHFFSGVYGKGLHASLGVGTGDERVAFGVMPSKIRIVFFIWRVRLIYIIYILSVSYFE